MVQDVLVGLAVSFGFVLGPLLGSWTTDEGLKLKDLDFVRYLRQIGYALPVGYALMLWVYWLLNLKELGAVAMFAMIMAQTSLTTQKRLDRTALKQGLVFLVLFSALSFIK